MVAISAMALLLQEQLSETKVLLQMPYQTESIAWPDESSLPFVYKKRFISEYEKDGVSTRSESIDQRTATRQSLADGRYQVQIEMVTLDVFETDLKTKVVSRKPFQTQPFKFILQQETLEKASIEIAKRVKEPLEEPDHPWEYYQLPRVAVPIGFEWKTSSNCYETTAKVTGVEIENGVGLIVVKLSRKWISYEHGVQTTKGELRFNRKTGMFVRSWIESEGSYSLREKESTLTRFRVELELTR